MVKTPSIDENPLPEAFNEAAKAWSEAASSANSRPASPSFSTPLQQTLTETTGNTSTRAEGAVLDSLEQRLSSSRIGPWVRVSYCS